MTQAPQFDPELSFRIDRCHNDLARLARQPDTWLTRLERWSVIRRLRGLEKRIP